LLDDITVWPAPWRLSFRNPGQNHSVVIPSINREYFTILPIPAGFVIGDDEMWRRSAARSRDLPDAAGRGSFSRFDE